MVEKYFSVSWCVMPRCKMLCAAHMWLFVNLLFSYEVFFLAFGIHNLSICSFCSILFNFFKSHVLVSIPNTNSMVKYSNNCQALALLKVLLISSSIILPQSVHPSVSQNGLVLIDLQTDWHKTQQSWQIFPVPLYGVLTEKHNFGLLMIGL